MSIECLIDMQFERLGILQGLTPIPHPDLYLALKDWTIWMHLASDPWFVSLTVAWFQQYHWTLRTVPTDTLCQVDSQNFNILTNRKQQYKDKPIRSHTLHYNLSIDLMI